ncbi:hypothetical protein ACFWVF_00530 [Streptomyces sp. NPDC058659]|uniref:hypothetical protein n=1 Tax=unclassified Streptomyces TaxID=2593676 RepID=UPI003658DC74
MAEGEDAECGMEDGRDESGGVQAGDEGRLRVLGHGGYEAGDPECLVEGAGDIGSLEPEDEGGQRAEQRDAEGVAELVAGDTNSADALRLLAGQVDGR